MDKKFVNVLMLGFGFMFLFTAFQTMGNIEVGFLFQILAPKNSSTEFNCIYEISLNSIEKKKKTWERCNKSGLKIKFNLITFKTNEQFLLNLHSQAFITTNDEFLSIIRTMQQSEWHTLLSNEIRSGNKQVLKWRIYK